MGIEPTTLPGDLAAGETVNHSAIRSFGRPHSGRAKNADFYYFGSKLIAIDRFRLADQNEAKFGRKILEKSLFTNFLVNKDMNKICAVFSNFNKND